MKKTILALCLITAINVEAQQTTLTVDNQTPGWLSSKITYSDQLSVERLKVTGYINGTDYNFLSKLVENNLKALDLEDVRIVEGGEPISSNKNSSGVVDYYYIRADVFGQYFDQHNFKDLQWLATPKSAELAFNTMLNDTLIVHSANGVLGYFSLWKNRYVDTKNKLFVIGEGISKVSELRHSSTYAYSTVDTYYEGTITLPSSMEYINGLWISEGKILSYIQEPESLSLVDCSIKCNELWVPVGTKEKYLNTSFKSAKNGAVQFFRGCLPCDNCRI